MIGKLGSDTKIKTFVMLKWIEVYYLMHTLLQFLKALVL